MAKMIKCPTCGTQIEVPPQAAGQIVKCPGCGKGLKLVAKPKPGGASQQQAGAGMSGHPGGSVAGSSVSAMTFVGEPPPNERPGPPLDDMPSLDSSCAVCGRPADPDELVEDNGRLVCRDCIKGARSGMARPEGGAELIDFKPAALPARRGKLINFTPSFFIGVLAALVLLGTQTYLTLFEKPVGTQTALARTTTPGNRGTPAPVPTAPDPETTPPPAAAPDVAPAAPAAPGTTPPPANGDASGATAPAATDPTAQRTPEAPAAPSDPTNPNTAAPTAGTPPASNPAIAMADNPDSKSIFSDGPAGSGDAGAKDAAAAPPGAAPVDPGAPPAPDVAVADASLRSTDPLARGLERLKARDYTKAATDFDSARSRYVIGRLKEGISLTPQQQTTLEGLAASYIGQRRYESARSPLETLHLRNVRSRSLILNTAIYMLNGQRQLNALTQTAEMVRQHMGHQQNDEYAADIFGSLVHRIEQTGKAPGDQVSGWWTFHDNYIDALAARGEGAPAGKLKWGVDWLPADEVKIARRSRGVTNPEQQLEAAAKEAKLAAQRVKSAEITLKNANAARAGGQAADVEGAQAQLDAARVAFDKAQKALAELNEAINVKKPRWLTHFEPVIPTPPPPQ